MNTKWKGLWAQDRQGFYAGSVFKKSDIPKYTRVVLRYNKFYEKGGNRPRFVYCFADSEGYQDKCVKMEYEESIQSKVDELAEVLRKGKHNADIMRLPSESQIAAKELFEKAVSLVEEITGEEWNFSYLTI